MIGILPSFQSNGKNTQHTATNTADKYIKDFVLDVEADEDTPSDGVPVGLFAVYNDGSKTKVPFPMTSLSEEIEALRAEINVLKQQQVIDQQHRVEFVPVDNIQVEFPSSARLIFNTDSWNSDRDFIFPDFTQDPDYKKNLEIGAWENYAPFAELETQVIFNSPNPYELPANWARTGTLFSPTRNTLIFPNTPMEIYKNGELIQRNSLSFDRNELVKYVVKRNNDYSFSWHFFTLQTYFTPPPISNTGSSFSELEHS